MTTLSKKLTVFLFLLLGLQMSVAVAQDTNSFPSVRLNSKTLEVQNQADEVFDRRAYDRAYFIFRNELATIGDKYGQYMVGFMYVTGKGVEEDRVALSRGAPSAARPSLRGPFYGRRKPSEYKGPGKERIRPRAIPAPSRRHPVPSRPGSAGRVMASPPPPATTKPPPNPPGRARRLKRALRGPGPGFTTS